MPLQRAHVSDYWLCSDNPGQKCWDLFIYNLYLTYLIKAANLIETGQTDQFCLFEACLKAQITNFARFETLHESKI